LPVQQEFHVRSLRGDVSGAAWANTWSDPSPARKIKGRGVECWMVRGEHRAVGRRLQCMAGLTQKRRRIAPQELAQLAGNGLARPGK
jgi:hypothetical protein